jgi:DNA-binding response OmpR family regulator
MAYVAVMVKARVLIVEDDEAIGDGLSRALITEGYATEVARRGLDALEAVSREAPDLILLDLGLPDLDGIDVCRRLRSLAPDTVIVIVTARDNEIDVVVGLDAGADDYVTKPFRLSELAARMRAHLRRLDVGSGPAVIEVGDLVIDRAARRAWIAGELLMLRAKEFDLLSLLAAAAGRALTRDEIMEQVWDAHWYGSTKTLDMHISSLRRKLGESGDAPGRLTTLRGVGYRFEVP